MITLLLISVNSSNVWKLLKTKSEMITVLDIPEFTVTVQKMSLLAQLLGIVMILKITLLKSLLIMKPTVIMLLTHKINLITNIMKS
jgi:hypothetical protein